MKAAISQKQLCVSFQKFARLLAITNTVCVSATYATSCASFLYNFFSMCQDHKSRQSVQKNWINGWKHHWPQQLTVVKQYGSFTWIQYLATPVAVIDTVHGCQHCGHQYLPCDHNRCGWCRYCWGHHGLPFGQHWHGSWPSVITV